MGKRGLWTLTWNLQCPGASRRPPAANGDFGEVEQRGRRTGAGRERGVGSHLPAESRFSGMPSGRQLPGPAVGDRRAPCGPGWGCPLPRARCCRGGGQCATGLGVAAGVWPLLWRPQCSRAGKRGCAAKAKRTLPPGPRCS